MSARNDARVQAGLQGGQGGVGEGAEQERGGGAAPLRKMGR